MISVVSKLSLKNIEKHSAEVDNPTTLKVRRIATYLKDLKANPVYVCQPLIDDILRTVDTLEENIIVNHEKYFKLLVVLEQKSEQLEQLNMALDLEKKRSQRLIQLSRGLSAVDDQSDTDYTSCPAFNRSPSNFMISDSISPLLMHERLEELSTSYKHCKKILSSRNCQLKQQKCEIEKLQADFEYLLAEYITVQKRMENLCNNYFRMQKRKNHEIDMLREALTRASECVVYTQFIIERFNLEDNLQFPQDPYIFQKFREHFVLFQKSLGSCHWIKTYKQSLDFNDSL